MFTGARPRPFADCFRYARDGGLAPALIQMRFEPLARQPVGADLIRIAREAVAFVVEDDVLDVAAELAKPLDHLVGLGLDDARVLRALDDEQRRAHLVDVRDRRALEQELLLRLSV